MCVRTHRPAVGGGAVGPCVAGADVARPYGPSTVMPSVPAMTGAS